MTENKRYTVIHLGNPVDCVIKDHTSDNTIGIFSSMHNPVNEVCDLLNEQDQRIQELEKDISASYDTINDLEERNQNQYTKLREVWDLILTMDHEKLKQMAEKVEKQETQLEKEWRIYQCVTQD